jgi:hypothetical protein
VAHTDDVKQFAASADAPGILDAMRSAEPLAGRIRTQTGDGLRQIASFTLA